MTQNCPFCKFPLLENYSFCPNCGKQLKTPEISLWQQISIYLISFLLPPIGLWPGIKYLKKEGKKEKTIGLTAIILTIISTIITLWLTFGFISQINQNLNQF